MRRVQGARPQDLVRPGDRRELERFVAMKLDLTPKNEANQAKLATYGVAGCRR